MCHHVHVQLSADEAKSVRKWTGILIPAYGLALLALFAAVSLTQPPRQGESITASAQPPAGHR